MYCVVYNCRSFTFSLRMGNICNIFNVKLRDLTSALEVTQRFGMAEDSIDTKRWMIKSRRGDISDRSATFLSLQWVHNLSMARQTSTILNAARTTLCTLTGVPVFTLYMRGHKTVSTIGDLSLQLVSRSLFEPSPVESSVPSFPLLFSYIIMVWS